jgi:hypothetical protein
MGDILLPESAINLLPLSAEPLDRWRRKTDIRRFIDALYADTYPPFSDYLYKNLKKEMGVWSKQFTKQAQDVSSQGRTPKQTIPVPNFFEEANFGRATKYVAAWKACVQNLLEESGFYSLAHVLESEQEIECSLLLASHCYYKQAVQVLRNFVEETFLPINFCDNVNDFNQWKANNYRTPPLRGRDGLVKKLVTKEVVSATLGKEIEDLYGDLNSYIHGSENRLIHKGIHTGSWTGLLFKPVDFTAWCGYLSRSIDVGIRLLRINYVQWEQIRATKWANLRSQGKILCDTCHNEEEFDIIVYPPEDWDMDIEAVYSDGTRNKVDRSFPGVISHIYRCRRCGNKTTVDPDPHAPIRSYRIEVTINSGEVSFEDLFL